MQFSREQRYAYRKGMEAAEARQRETDIGRIATALEGIQRALEKRTEIDLTGWEEREAAALTK